MPRIEYSYVHAPTIKEFAQSQAFIRGLMGPFGSGKSSACVIEIIKQTQKQVPDLDGIKKSRWAVIRNTYPQLNDTTIKTFLDWIPESHFGKYNKAEHTYTITGIPGMHIEVLFRALDNPGHVKNLLSLELTGAWLNEAREIPWEIVKPLMGRVGRYPSAKSVGATWYGIICDTNPPDTDSWWYDLFETDKYSKLAKDAEQKLGRDFCQVFKQPSGLSPDAENTNYLPKGYYETLAADPDLDWVKVHVHGEYGFIKTGKAVYPTYSDSLHCRDLNVIGGLPIIRGWDYGLTPACVFHQVTPSGQLRVIDELTSERAGIEAFSDYVIKYCSREYSGFGFEDYGDPAGIAASQTDEKSCFSIQQAKGIQIQPGEQTLELRLESVRYGLNNLIDGEPALVVSPKCKMIRKGFQGGYNYRRIISSSERYTDKPDKNKYSHPHDAHQYVACEIFGDIIRGMAKFNKEPLQHYANDSFDVFGDQPTRANDSFDLFG